MKLRSGLALIALTLTLAVSGYAQETASAAESVEQLKGQLLEVQEKEDALRTRLQQLDESIKPENIERSLAGVGSTRPEELREARRRQLSIERDGVLAQLRTIETSRTRLETALANAEVLAYQQSARPQPPLENNLAASGSRFQWFVFGGGAGLALLALGGGAFAYRRKTRSRQR
jgi:phage shock protein A